jgi:hypothetical protein
VLLVEDRDSEVREAAERTLGRIPVEALQGFLARPDVPVDLREFFGDRGILPADIPAIESDEPLIEIDTPDPAAVHAEEDRETAVQRIGKMGFSERLKAAIKGSREMRAILIRDPNRVISISVLSSPKVTEQEVEGFARMAVVSEDVLRVIGTNRAWMKNYGIVVGLVRNPKTPLAMSLNLLARLSERDLTMLSVDRNVPESLRVAARKKVVANVSRR